MDIGESLNYSVIGFGELLNSSNTTTEPVSVGETFKWTDAEITRLIQIIFRPLKNLSTCFYMFVLPLPFEIYLQGTINQSRICQESNTVYIQKS